MPWKDKEKNRAATRKWCKKNDRARRLRVYGITPEQYDALLEMQGGCCALCGSADPQAPWAGTFAVDHDHATGKVRGLLCIPCNLGLGHLKDSPEILRRAVDYLENA